MAVLYTLIGDLVGSRALPDRGAAQGALAEALVGANAVMCPVQPLEATVGDEFQGGFSHLADAARASLLVRLTLLPVVDTRCGLGHGETSVYDETRTPLLQDGPGWWAARDAIDALASGRSHRRTWFVERQGSQDRAGAVNAFLTCRDQLVERLNDRGLRMLRLALLGLSQKQIAEAEDVWPSAVSQQFSRGVGAIVDGHALLGGGTGGH
ncbi:SatD family protein [Nocardioides mesophilus]|uniref:RNA polymerase subunit sigma-70 n=1 Tax=Nocardioides mesophilus TaxID=433659 RepID=A0A7G9RG09_9ACTN|nr:SatD family protein [Nocardioides mesophilus]QNN54534.1 hypothetical protein H9L09_09615 [Nocardioides mesophilus]